MLKQSLYDWAGTNTGLFHVLNDLRGPILDDFMLLGTQIGDHALFPIYLTVIVLTATIATTRDPNPGQKRTMRWLDTLSVLCVAYLLNAALIMWAKHRFDFPRPLLALPPGAVHVIGESEYYRSLPSGHASFAMVIAASLWPMLNGWQRWTAAFFVMWVGVSRVNVGAHFPADIVASWLTALSIVLLVRIVDRHLHRFLETRR